MRMSFTDETYVAFLQLEASTNSSIDRLTREDIII